MDKPGNRPRALRYMRDLCFIVAFIPMFLQKDIEHVDWTTISLLFISILGFAGGCIFEIRDIQAKEAWQRNQPVVDQPEGGPDLPHIRQTIAMMIGVTAFLYFAYLGVALKDSPFTGNDWMMFLLLPVAIAGLGYARWIQTQYDKAAQEWRLTKPHNQ